MMRSEVAIAPNSSLVLNLRATDSYRRRVAWSADGGDVWTNSSNVDFPEPGERGGERRHQHGGPSADLGGARCQS